MSEKKAAPFSHPRWKDIPKPEVIGHCEVSEEEKNDPEFLAFIEREMERRKKLEHGNSKFSVVGKGLHAKRVVLFIYKFLGGQPNGRRKNSNDDRR